LYAATITDHFSQSGAIRGIGSKGPEESEKLDKFYDRIMRCDVVVEAHHKHHHKGNLYHVRIDLTVPGSELVVNREPDEHHA
jgi:hypothetical protein